LIQFAEQKKPPAALAIAAGMGRELTLPGKTLQGPRRHVDKAGGLFGLYKRFENYRLDQHSRLITSSIHASRIARYGQSSRATQEDLRSG
jgi:hypothetical protein